MCRLRYGPSIVWPRMLASVEWPTHLWRRDITAVQCNLQTVLIVSVVRTATPGAVMKLFMKGALECVRAPSITNLFLESQKRRL